MSTELKAVQTSQLHNSSNNQTAEKSRNASGLNADKHLPEGGQSLPLTDKQQPNKLEHTNDLPAGEDISNAVKHLNDYMQNLQRELQFSVDDQTGRTVIKVLDSETDTVIRQIPPEEILDLARKLKDQDDDKGKLLQVQA
jgi:flagellar protein FlaG